MKKGSVTVYMSLTLALLMSLFLTVIEGAKARAVSVDAECAFDLSVLSIFGEYNRRLQEEYGLFFIDTAYGESTASTERVKNHLQYYMEENLKKQVTGPLQFDFTKTYVERVEITGASYATDKQGEVFERQAVEYMKHRYGLSYGEKMKKELEIAKEYELFTKDVSGERNAQQAIIDETEKNGIETGKTDEKGDPVRKKVDVDNPADNVNAVRNKGILLLLIPEEERISEKAADLSTCVSYIGAVTEGLGLENREGISLAEQFLFDAYVLEKCGTYRNPKKTGQLEYQAEYVLAGKNNDVDNLESVTRRLLALREVSNVIYLFSDGAKVSEALALSTVICEAAGAVVLIEPVKFTLLFAWAYAEAVYDVKQLLAGNRIPLMKTSADWHYSLQGMLQVDTEQVVKETSPGNGLGYEEYLRLFLAVTGEKQKVFRMMDVAELDVRKNSGFSDFSMCYCVDLLIMEATVGSKYGYYKEMKRKYFYI